MVSVRPLRRLEAARFGRYPSLSAAACTRLASAGSTVGTSLITRETVFTATPASAATSRIVGRAVWVTESRLAGIPHRLLVSTDSPGQIRLVRHVQRTHERDDHQNNAGGFRCLNRYRRWPCLPVDSPTMLPVWRENMPV